MEIRLAEKRELCEILSIYESARVFMRESGNPNQWAGKYPDEETVTRDIEQRKLRVCTENGEILAVFFYDEGEDPTYNIIYDGEWLNDRPCGVIHRIAVSDKARGRGVAQVCFDYAFTKCGNVKIDTHRDNIPMQKSLVKNGFVRCGIIYLANGDERVAFQRG
ncbi:MAG: N-acetyltransferase [Clostridia bacterium]|nr:N-acetyltransferase [Clostridia bacterium]